MGTQPRSCQLGLPQLGSHQSSKSMPVMKMVMNLWLTKLLRKNLVSLISMSYYSHSPMLFCQRMS